MKKTARTKLSERNMHWDETYTENTKKFKEMYEDIIGKGSYFRWEGKDADSGDTYFVIVGPAKMKTPKASWFAGCRKLPSDWAAGGKYFSEMKEAVKYANETWGVPIPSDFKWGYDSSDLKNISDKMEEWREARTAKAKGDGLMNKFSILTEFPIHIYRESMGATPWKTRQGYVWFDADQLVEGDPGFESLVEEKPELSVAKNAALDERAYRRLQISNMYGPEYLQADFYQVFIGHKPDEGTYIISIGPYCGTQFGEAFDKFGLFKKKLNIVSQETIDKEINNYIAEYLHNYGVHLVPSDIRVSGVETSEIVVDLNKSGVEKVRAGKIYQKNLNYYKEKYDIKTITEANKKFQEETEDYKNKLESFKKAYEEAKKSGEALSFDIPPPPRIDLKKRKVGQQIFSTIYKEKPQKGMTQEEKMLRYGFDSLQEALDHIMATMPGEFPIQKISAAKPVTSADLRKAREKHDKQKKLEEQSKESKENVQKGLTDEKVVATPSSPIIEHPIMETPENIPIVTQPKKDVVRTTKPRTLEEIKNKYLKEQDIEQEAVTKTILNLVKLAETLDKENKSEDAEEIHKILRKHMGN